MSRSRPDRPISVVIADDLDLLREGLKEILRTVPGLAVVGVAGTGAEAVAAVADERPDVVLLDVELPGDDVLTTVRRMNTASAGTRVIILSRLIGPDLLRGLLNAGISGHLPKSATREELVAMVRTAGDDGDRVMLSVSRGSLAPAVDSPARDLLSARECEVLQLAAGALSNTEIARRLGLTEGTVKRHLSNVYAKLGAVSRIDAVNKAAAAALIVPPSTES
ncbi:response regulator [Actinomadura rugatobispora]|uniref:Response regulator n=1 Tax=Actinomadura rugatobispora TaxID=1994 RepID=A0ABW0ZNS5_9ACTN|nr:response regulator transcription factor [Actinomadura rugatobispora]